MFTESLLDEFIKTSNLIPHELDSFQEVLNDICTFFSHFTNGSVFVKEKVAIFYSLISILDNSYCSLLEDSLKQLISSMDENLVKDLVAEKLAKLPSPGVFIAVCSMKSLSNAFIKNICKYAITFSSKIPSHHMAVFILKFGINIQELKDEWLRILINLVPFIHWNAINVICCLLNRYNDLISFVPIELIQGVTSNIENVGPSNLILSLKFLCFFYQKLPNEILIKYEITILSFESIALETCDENVVSSFISLIYHFNHILSGNTDFKACFYPKVLDLFLSKSGNFGTEFIHQKYFELLNVLGSNS